MTYQPKSVGKMEDFETFILCISSVFLQRLSYKVFSVPDKKFDFQPSLVFKFIFLTTPGCYGLDVTWNSCIGGS